MGGFREVRFDPEGRVAIRPGSLRLMLRELLRQRFKLVVHQAAKETTVFAARVAKGGLRIHKVGEGEPMPSRPEEQTSAGASAPTEASPGLFFGEACRRLWMR